MIKKRFLLMQLVSVCIVLCTSALPACSKTTHIASADNRTPVEKYGQLKIAGVHVTDQNNQPVQLRGMSLFWSQSMGKFYNAQTVKWLKNDWRCTAVRAAMGIESGGYLTNPEAEKAKVMAVVDAAIAEGLYVVIDWHDHHAQDHVEQSKAFFSEMAARYGDKPNVIYEIYNEPEKETAWSTQIKPYADAVIKAIRAKDPDNIIVVGTPHWSQDVDVAANDPLRYSNIAYSLHYYAATHKQSLRDKATAAINKGLALFVTEFGISEASGTGYLDETEKKTWWTFLDDHKISWLNWSVTDKDETSAALLPGASGTGNWPETSISRSGKMVRDELRLKNP
jgi:endoglucanase